MSVGRRIREEIASRDKVIICNLSLDFGDGIQLADTKDSVMVHNNCEYAPLPLVKMTPTRFPNADSAMPANIPLRTVVL